MRITTRLTERLAVEVPILSAPMGAVAGGRLAAAVTHAGGLGLIGGGYGDPDWQAREFDAAGNARVGCGFITWALAERPHLLDLALARGPVAVMLSFGSPAPFAARIREAGALLILQVQSMEHARAALDAGADIVVAQGGEAGGHSGRRATLTLVPEVADLLAARAPGTLLVAAGGIADGRGLAAALMLGADGVLLGSRLMASLESAAPEGFRPAIAAADGDATIKTASIDTVRGHAWPGDEFRVRALRNRFTEAWHDRDAELAAPGTREDQRERYWAAYRAGDAEHAGVLMGEAVGLVREVEPVATIVERMVAQAAGLLSGAAARVVP